MTHEIHYNENNIKTYRLPLLALGLDDLDDLALPECEISSCPAWEALSATG